jgi:hypothetical protein
MSDSLKQRYINARATEGYISSLVYACAAQGNEYGYSYYWWYYDIPTSNSHALGESN